MDGGHVLYGRSDASVRVVEFADFQCGACAEAGKELRRLYDEHPDLLAATYRHYPLRALHEYAYVAATAAECAADRGAFPAYHDVLFDDQRNIGVVSWTTFAARADVGDTVRFRRCLQDAVTHERVARDTALAYRLGVRVTPTFVVNGNLLLMPPTHEQWERLLKGLAAAAVAETGERR